jgi:rod shape-determining protein MreB
MSDNFFSAFLGRDMAVDLGTANTLVYVRGRGIVLNEPSVVAVNVKDGRPLAVGLEAKRMIGRTPGHIQAVRPLRDGVINNFEITEKMLRYFITRVHQRRWAKPRMVICVPSGVTGVEKRAVQEAAEYAGARKTPFIIEEPMAAAIGSGLPVQEPTGNMIVDIGGGTTEVAVISLGGIVLNEPSVVAVNVKDGRPLAVGLEAKRMIGRTPGHIQAVRPLRDGVINNFEITEKMLRYFITRVHQRRWAKPRMVICVPSGVTGVEKRAVQEAAEYAGARKTPFIIEEPMAAAIGAGLPVHEPTGNMVVDIGGGTTEVAVISLGGIVTSQSVRIAGDELDDAIIQFIKKEYSLALGERTAEEIKIALGSAYPLEEELRAEIRGRDLVTGLPKTIVTSTEEVRRALDEPVSAIVDSVKVTLDKTPPELAADIMEAGIVLTGGGALLHGLDVRLRAETGMPIVIANNPLFSVALGAGQCLEEFNVLRQVLSGNNDR